MDKVFRINFETPDGDSGSLTASTDQECDIITKELEDDGYIITEIISLRN